MSIKSVHPIACSAALRVTLVVVCRNNKMMIILRDDRVIEIFDSPNSPPDWIEGMDIENQEYQFCDDIGQIYVGQISKSSSSLRQASWSLQPFGDPDIRNLKELINKAEVIEPNDQFPNIETLKNHTNRVRGSV